MGVSISPEERIKNLVVKCTDAIKKAILNANSEVRIVTTSLQEKRLCMRIVAEILSDPKLVEMVDWIKSGDHGLEFSSGSLLVVKTDSELN